MREGKRGSDSVLFSSSVACSEQAKCAMLTLDAPDSERKASQGSDERESACTSSSGGQHSGAVPSLESGTSLSIEGTPQASNKRTGTGE